jgi:hypothetical protein
MRLVGERKFILVSLRAVRNRKLGANQFCRPAAQMARSQLVQRLAARIAASYSGSVQEKREATGAAILCRLGTSIP